MLKVAAQCHLHGLVHRDMKPEVIVGKELEDVCSTFCYEFIGRSCFTTYFSICHDMYISVVEFSFQINKSGLTSQGYRFWSVRLHKTRSVGFVSFLAEVFCLPIKGKMTKMIHIW